MPNVIMTIPNAHRAGSERLVDYVPTIEVDTESTAPGTVIFKNQVPEFMHEGGFVRRPLAGLSVKPNTHAFVQVVDRKGNPVKVFNQLGSLGNSRAATPKEKDANKPLDDYWTDWLLQSVSEQRMEKSQIVETFGDPVLYVFGERPRLLSFQAILVNTADFNWRAQFWENWDRFFRATKLVESGRKIFIGFDDVLVSGYPLQASAVQSTNQPHMIKVSFSFYVADYMNTSMMDIGSVQRNRLRIPNKNEVITQRLGEFVPSTSYSDNVFGEAIQSNLRRVIGGQNLQFKEYFNKVFGGIAGVAAGGPLGGITTPSGAGSVYELLYDPGLRHVRGAKSATDYLLRHLNKQALRYAYKGVERLAAETPGGVPGLTFWFGFVANLYQRTALNAAQAIGGGGPTSKWGDMINGMATMGGPYGVASYMAYAQNSAMTTALKTADGSFAMSNLEYDVNFGLVSKKQNPAYGSQISYRKDAGFTRDSATYYASLVGQAKKSYDQSYPKMSFTSTKSASAEQGQFEFDPAVASDSEALDGEAAYGANKQSQSEEQAILVQRDELDVNHGGAVLLELDSDIEDDGTESD
jgi:hypothetical protein